MSVDPFANALIHLKNNDFVAKKKCEIKPATKLLESVLSIFAKEKYIDGFKRVEDEKNRNKFEVELNGNIVSCKAVKPRYAVENANFEKFEKRYLPSKASGILVVSTSSGVMTHIDAKKKNIGGRLLAYVY